MIGVDHKYLIYIASVITVYSGIDIILTPVWFSEKQDFLIDVTPIKWPLGVSFIICGVLLVYRERKKSKRKVKPLFYTICPNCKETYFYNKLKEGMCPSCDVKTVDMDKYYNSN